MRVPHYVTWPAIAALSWAVLDHLLPDLLPKVPAPIGIPIAIAAGLLLAVSAGVRGWSWLFQKLPWPWFPRPFWRVVFWLRHRPSVTIATATPTVDFGNTVLNASQFSLMLCRNLSNMPVGAVVDFDSAELVFSQIGKKDRRRRIYRPVETGGFLKLELSAGSCDFIMMHFSAMGLPAPLADAPDFTGDYELVLRGVRIDVRGAHPFSGEPVPALWRWFRVFGNSVPELTAGFA